MSDLTFYCFCLTFLLGLAGWYSYWLECVDSCELRADLEAARAANAILQDKLEDARRSCLAGDHELLCEPENCYDQVHHRGTENTENGG